MIANELRNAFGGNWEAGEREIHGLIAVAGRTLKIELLRASTWRSSVFERGACVASGSDADPVASVRAALETLDAAP